MKPDQILRYFKALQNGNLRKTCECMVPVGTAGLSTQWGTAVGPQKMLLLLLKRQPCRKVRVGLPGLPKGELVA